VGDTGRYAYDGATHLLSPRPQIYVVKSDAQTYYKRAVLDYYRAGASGFPKITWRAIAAP
jgi:hypothetical protein